MSRPHVHRSLLAGVASLALIWVAHVLYVANWVTISVRGGDASVGLDLLGARESVRWMLSALVGQSFEFASSLRACRSGAALDGLRFESGVTGASGALRAAAGGWSGALQVRRGSLSIGVWITPDAVETLLAPEPFWLDTELARIPDVCVQGGL